MPPVRDWHGGLVVVAWLIVPALLVAVRSAAEAGVYEARLDGHRVTIVSGHWSASFASGVTALVAATAVAVLAWLTYTWFAGSRDRRRTATMTERLHRRPLI